MTLYSPMFDQPLFTEETAQHIRAECYMPTGYEMPQGASWPIKVCSCCGFEGKACSSDADCGGEEAVCTKTPTRCREFWDQDDNAYMGDVRVKFDFNFGGQGSVFESAPREGAFSSHVLTVLDMPRAARGGGGETSVPSWNSSSASTQLLFSAFPCYSGTANQPPRFVQSLGSTSEDVQTEYVCLRSGPCEVPLFIRDFEMGTDGSESLIQTSDRIAIEAAIGSDAGDGQRITREDGRPCTGVGSLSCVFKLVTPDYVDGVGFSLPSGTTHVRCFAAVDVHAQSEAPAAKTCRSLPMCIKIRIEDGPSVYGFWQALSIPVAEIDGSISASQDLVLVSWTVSPGSPPFTAEVQYVFGNQTVYKTVPSSVSFVSQHSVSIPVGDMLSSADSPEGGRFTFRVIATTSSGSRLRSLRSNAVTLFPPAPITPGQLFAVSWQGQVLKVHGVSRVGSEPAAQEVLGSHLTHQVVQGQMTMDISSQVLYTVIAPAGGQIGNTELLASVPGTGEELQRINVNISSSALWNLEYDEAGGVIVSVSVMPESSWIALVNVETGSVEIVEQLATGARFGVSAMDQLRRVYFFIEPDSGNLMSFRLGAGGGMNPAISIAGADRTVLVMGFSAEEQALYALVSDWPTKPESIVELAILDMGTEVLRPLVVTSLVGSDIMFGSAAWDFDLGRCYVLSGQGQVVSYDFATNVSTRAPGLLPEEAFDLILMDDRTPEVRGVSPSTMRANGSPQLTVTGRNFGMRVGSTPDVSLDLAPCASVTKESDRRLICTLPLLNQDNADKTFGVTIQVRGWSNTYEGLITFTESWYGVSPNTSTTLSRDTRTTVLGYGFHEPFSTYRLLFISGSRVVSIGPPVSWTSEALEFDDPIWLQDAGMTKLELLHGTTAPLLYDRPVVKAIQNEIYFEFVEGWSIGVYIMGSMVNGADQFGFKNNSLSMFAMGNMTISIASLGIDTSAGAQYECSFSREQVADLRTNATAISGREVQCDVPQWNHPAGMTRLALYRRGSATPVQRAIDGVFIESASQDFMYVQGWTSLSPTQGSFTGNVTVTIDGFGFDPAMSYECTFSQGTSEVVVNGTVTDSQTLNCVTSTSPSEWLFRGPAIVSITADSLPVIKLGGAASFDFRPVWDSVAPSAVPAAGGGLVTVSGLGLRQDGANHKCIFNASDSGEMVETEWLQLAPDGQKLECPAPMWAYAAPLFPLTLTVISDISGSITVEERNGAFAPNAFDFIFTEEISGVTPTIAFAGGQDLTVSGSGFTQSSQIYECVFADAMNQSSRSPAAPANPGNTTTLVCPYAKWTHPAGIASLSVERQGVALAQAVPVISITFFEGWNWIKPEIPAHEATAIIKGGGFSPDFPPYMCRMVVGTAQPQIVAANLSGNNSDVLACAFGEWNGTAGPGTVELYRELPGGTFYPPASGSNVSVTNFTLIESITGFGARTNGTSLGGQNVTFVGNGFVESLNYTATWRESSGPYYTTSECGERVDIRTVICVTPEWNSDDTIAIVSLSSRERPVFGALAFGFFSQISSVSPSFAGADTPTIVTVAGAAFVQGASNYNCTWQYGSDAPISVQANATSVSELICETPVWQGVAAEGLAFNVLQGGDVLPVEANIFFDFSAKVSSVSPSQGLAKGLLVTLTGGGLDINHDYICTTMGNNSANSTRVSALNSTMLVCQLPPFTGENKNTFVRVIDASANEFILGMVPFSFIEGIVYLSQSIGPASGGTLLKVYGTGFEASKVYALEFNSDFHTEVSVQAIFVSTSLLTVVTPEWPHPASRADITISVDGIPKTASGTTPFYFQESISQYLPAGGLVFGSFVSITGQGFDPSISYIMTLDAVQASNRSLDIVPARTLVLPPKRASTTTGISFTFPKWLFPAGPARMTIARNDSVVGNTTVVPFSGIFEFAAGWISANVNGSGWPSEINFVGGNRIVVNGGGFDSADSTGYSCVFVDATQGSCRPGEADCLFSSSSDKTLPTHLRGPANATSWGNLTCFAPTWLYERREASLRIYRGNTLIEKAYTSGLSTSFSGNIELDPNHNHNGPSKGGVRVSIVGTNFGINDLSDRVRISNTSCEATEWISNTHVWCKVPRKISGAKQVDMAISVSPYRISELKLGFNYDGPKLNGVSRLLNSSCNVTEENCTKVSNHANRGGETVTLTGSQFQSFDLTATATVGGTTCEASPWQSDTSIFCKLAKGTGVQKGATIVLGSDDAEITKAFSYDRPSVRETVVVSEDSTMSTLGETEIEIFGFDFAFASYSQTVRVGGTACEASEWSSDSSISCKASAGVGATKSVVVTGGQWDNPGTLTQALRYSSPNISAPAKPGVAMDGEIGGVNLVTFGGMTKVIVEGDSFGQFDYTAKLRVGFTAAEQTVWMSDSSAYCKTARGVASTLAVMLTSGVLVGTNVALVSYDSPALVAGHAAIDEGQRSDGFNFTSSGVGVKIENGIGVGGDWDVRDSLYPKLERPSINGRWYFCKDITTDQSQNCEDARDVLDVESPIWGTVVRQDSNIVAQYTSLLDGLTEGTSLVHRRPSSYSKGFDHYDEYTVVAQFYTTGNDWVGVSFRYCDDDNYYRLEMNAVYSTIRLKKRVAGVVTILWTAQDTNGYTPGSFYTVRIEVFGQDINCFLDEYPPSAWPASGLDLHGQLSIDRQYWTPICIKGSSAAWCNPEDSTRDLENQCPSYDAAKGISRPGNQPSIALWSGGSEFLYFMNVGMFKPYRIAKHSNMAAFGRQVVTIIGANFATSHYSPANRVGGSACEMSSWISDSAIASKVISSVGATHRLVVTAGIRAGTTTEAISYDLP